MCRAPLLLLVATCFAASGADNFQLDRPILHSGMCDASAAVAISSNLFLVGNDEDNLLRLYRAGTSAPPVATFDLSTFLQQRARKSPEADIEGAARIGNRVFWIGSHGRNKDGKDRPGRRCLFATDISDENSNLRVTPVGKTCRTLLEQIAADPRYAPFHLDSHAALAPKEEGGINIEGLAATPEGGLLIGFRNPVPGSKALVVPLLNPNQAILEAPAEFGPPILLDLGGSGIRDMAYCDGSWLIIAGSYHSGGRFELYHWPARNAQPQRLKVKHLNRCHPETLVIYPQLGFKEFQILSDDGTLKIDDCPCKDLTDPGLKHFRSFWVLP